MLRFAHDFRGQPKTHRSNARMSRFWKWTLGTFLGLLVAAFVGLSFLAGSPKDVYGLVRYSLPHMHRGKLRAGDDGPDVRLLTLARSHRFHLLLLMGARRLPAAFV